jgi:hypothetical protein
MKTAESAAALFKRKTQLNHTAEGKALNRRLQDYLFCQIVSCASRRASIVLVAGLLMLVYSPWRAAKA